MSLLNRIRSWVHASLHRRDLERRIEVEMQTHLELHEADLRRGGLSEQEARRRARAEFGATAARKEECREALGLRLVDELRGDIPYAFRLLRRSPAFAIVAVSSLGLGIGANTAIFTLVDTVLMKTLPVGNPKTLFFIDNSGGKSGGSNGPPYPCFELLRDHNHFFSGMAAFSEARFKVTIDGPPELMRGQFVSGTYFDVLGVSAGIGRVLTPADDNESARDATPAVISHTLWTRRFNSDPAVLGKTMQVGTHSVTIVGVTRPEFFGLQVGSPIDVTVPMWLSGNRLTAKQNWWFSVVGRLKDGASVEQARGELDTLFDGYMTENGMTGDKRDYFSGISLVPAGKGANALRRQFSDPLRIMMTIVALVLMIGCANVANLLLARASARRSEIALRRAIGASRPRIIRQLLTEGAVLVTMGAVAGLVFARWGVTVLLGIIFADAPGGIPLHPPFDLRVLSFTAGIALLTALCFSLAPAIRASRTASALENERTASGSRSRMRFGQSLIAFQVMLAVVLLYGAVLFVRTVHNLNAVDTGYRRDSVLTMQVEATFPQTITPSASSADNAVMHAHLGATWQEFTDRLSNLPGIRAAAVGTLMPLTGRNRGVVMAVTGVPKRAGQDRGIRVNEITDRYFDVVGIGLISGREFNPRDRAGSPRVAILNQTAVRAFFDSATPIGRRVSFPGQRVEDEYEIVGVVRDAQYENLRTPDGRMVYLPIEQSIDPVTSIMAAASGAGDVTRLVSPIREVVKATVPGGFVTRVGTIDQRIRASLVRERLLSMLATFFGALALVLASIGLYGVIAYSVVRRTHEIGIRLAVGASGRAVIWIVVRDLLILVMTGAALGVVSAINAGRYVESQLFAVSARDPIAVVAAILLLFGMAAAAAYLPARRASLIDPAIALRYE